MTTFGEVFGKQSYLYLNRNRASNAVGTIAEIFDGCNLSVEEFFGSEEYQKWYREYLLATGQHPLRRLAEKVKRVKWNNPDGYITLLGAESIKVMSATLVERGLLKI